MDHRKKEESLKIIVFEEKETQEGLFCGRMLEYAQLECVMPVTVHVVNNHAELWYDGEGCCSLRELGEEKRWNSDEVFGFFQALAKLTEDLKSHFLDTSVLLLEPDVVYYHTEQKKLLFCCGNKTDERLEDRVERLLWYFLPRIKKIQKTSMRYLYQIQYLMQEMEFAEIAKKLLTAKLEQTLPEEPLQLPEVAEQAGSYVTKKDTVPQVQSPGKQISEKGGKHRFWRKRESSETRGELPEVIPEQGCFLQMEDDWLTETEEICTSPYRIGSARNLVQMWLPDSEIKGVHVILHWQSGWKLYVPLDGGFVEHMGRMLAPGESCSLENGDLLKIGSRSYRFERMQTEPFEKLDFQRESE